MTIDLTELGKEAGPLFVYCLGIFFATLAVRRGIEAFFPKVLAWPPWKKFFVRSMPPLIGGVAAVVMHKFPFLNTLPSWGTRFVYGMVAGGLSGFGYSVVKAVVEARYGVKVKDGSSEPPPAPDSGTPTQPIPRDSLKDTSSEEPKP